MKRRVSIKDIAEAAGVSAPTVSRALQNRGRVSERTRQQILAIAKEMGYTPSLVARGLVTQHSRSVGLVVTSFADPFHSEVTQGVEEEATRHNYSIFLGGTAEDPDQELKIVRTLLGHQVDGIIVSSSRVGNRYAELLQASGVPLILINTHVEGENIHSVYHDDYAGSRLICEHLIQRGYQRIAYMGNHMGGCTNVARRQGWLDTVDRAPEVTALPCYDAPVGGLEGGVRAAQQLLRWRASRHGLPDAAAFYNDIMAIGAIAVLTEHGVRIPREIAIAGFDDIDVAAYTIPPLTTLQQPRRQMGREAMRRLLTLIQQEVVAGPQSTKMLGQLIIRKST